MLIRDCLYLETIIHVQNRTTYPKWLTHVAYLLRNVCMNLINYFSYLRDNNPIEQW